MFFTEVVLKGMLVSDMWVAAMHEGMRQVFVRAGAWLKLVGFVGSERGGA